ncbi:MAG: hypothetical protein GY795_33325 [Desulfobacterales bacterium]|nr:hypothetical protein [Desulfobacterales bacterium]
MKCPTCNKNSLKPIKIEAGLPGAGCIYCGGVLISLLTYRNWLEHIKNQGGLQIDSNKANAEVTTEDSKNALLCPKCTRIMLKYRISSASENYADLCPYCAETWLDSGEWMLLIQLEIHDKLPTIFTEPWQKQIRKERAAIMYSAKYEEQFGEDDYREIKKIREWIYNHPEKEKMMYYLTDKDPYKF